MRQLTIVLITAVAVFTYSHMCFSELYISAASGSTDYGELAEDVSSIELTLGIRAHENLAFEAAWLNLGDTHLDLANGYTTDLSIHGFKLGAKGILPISPELSIYATSGVYFWDLQSDQITSQTLIQSNGVEQDSDIYIGAGVEWVLTDELSVNLNYQEINVVGDNIENVSAGLKFSF